MSEKISHKFPNGTEFTGSFEELQKVASVLGYSLKGVKLTAIPRGYYPSETQGAIPIKDMPEYHQRRALLKYSKDYLTNVFDKDDSVNKFLEKFTALPGDPIVQDLYNALNSGVSKG